MRLDLEPHQRSSINHRRPHSYYYIGSLANRLLRRKIYFINRVGRDLHCSSAYRYSYDCKTMQLKN
jgi:hypothetical protein